MGNKILNLLLILSLINPLSLYALPDAPVQPLPLNPEYIGFIHEKINSSFIYPEEARLKGWEGIVKVKFTIDQNGRIKDIDIAQSSGYPLLDAAAILAIKDASPYPFPGVYSKNKEIEIILPINYAQLKPETEFTIPVAQPAAQVYQAESPKKEEPTPIPVFSLPVQPTYNKEDSQEIHLVYSTNQELAQFNELALKNNQPTKVAREEVELAQIKKTEAKRNLFPQLKMQAYSTEGEVNKVDYEEREGKLQADQPIYYGGRLKDTLKQAEVNLEITQKNYDRLKFDVIQKTETAYYNLVAARMHLNKQKTLQDETKEMMGKIERLYSIGMAIPLELTSAKSGFEQINFKIDTIKQEIFMAELTFKQVLNIKELPDIKTELIEAKKLTLDYDTCLQIALTTRPEIYLSELLVKFNEYGQKVEAAKNKAPTIDVTGSYGFYQGHYLTEPWKNSDNWYAGLKGSLPWGASTMNTSYASDNTKPRFGQTSPTKSNTMSAEFNLLDNLRRKSDKKRADIDMHRAVSDFNESVKTVNFEVQDAFLNYQKAVLQLSAADSEMKYRRNELDVTKIRAMTGDASLSAAIGSLVSLSDATEKYIQALANYQISLANLKKATGYGLRI